MAPPDGAPLDTPLPRTTTTSSAALARALSALYARVPLGMRLGLEAMREACARAGNPENAFEVAHVGGTNGKGSTCAMVEAMVRATGKKTGLYTSPHLARFAERIRIDGVPIDDEALAAVLERAMEIGPDLSFFETATLAAFLAFRDHGVEVAVIEVGIGGRLDATNVIAAPRVAAVTRVAFDHMDRLGDTLEKIAREKAAIAKSGMPIVLGPMAPEVRAAALEVALAAGALPIVMGDDPEALPRDATLALGGGYQHDNARIAWRIARELGIPESARREGLARAVWPGRFEEIAIAKGKLRGTWIFDGAHNPDGARALVAAIRDLGARSPERMPGALVFGALADKAWREMLDVLAALPFPRFYVAPRGRAATPPPDLAAHAQGVVSTSLPLALTKAHRAAAKHSVVVCGSLYLVGEARALLLGEPTDPPVAL
ncbi:MAG: bifunctional folylpolyglutamate synthase/dihydrofolate synthase [Deltaproteobacteria bacterium]|nr:bifunctional folylpolyglutamate synthase/dihydrofolate synthase [Deltaproteobacteria bacterium]